MRPIRPLISRYAPYCVVFLFALTVSCGGSPVPCDADILVTKTADTNDGACTGTDCSLREAVIRANVCAGTQTIRIPAGTYTLTHAGSDEDAAATGDLDITDNVTILGDGNPVIDGNATDRIFHIFPGATANLSGLILQNGRAISAPGIFNRGVLNLNESIVQNNTAVPTEGISSMGGGILSSGNGSLGVYLSEIRGNSASRGGGIAADTGAGGVHNVMISYSKVSDNSAYEHGGGVYLANDVTATIVRFEGMDNTAQEKGGGIYNAGTLELTYATLEGNSAVQEGGGIYNAGGATIISRSVLVQSNQSENGGGMYNMGMAHFYQSALVHNQAVGGEGGGVYNFNVGAALLLDNSTISSNGASLGGDGIRNLDGDLRFMFATIAHNASEGVNSSAWGEMTMRNTILAGHPGGNCVGTPVDSIGHNIDDGVTCALDEPSDLSSTDPMLDPLPPGVTIPPTHALQAGSPAIDTADPDRCAGTDQRGVIRPQGANCDRGAYEREVGGGGSALISGKVWHDLCAVPDGPIPATPPPGCVDTSPFSNANGILEPGEPGIPGVTLRLKAGTCAAGTDLMTAVTDATGDFAFSGLAAGAYCVSIDALGDGNDLVLIPGGWTFPASGGTVAQTDIVLTAGEIHPGANFGWDYQFLPAWTGPETTPTPTSVPLSFIDPWISTDHIYYVPPFSNYQCDPKEAEFRVGLTSLEGVANVLLFVQLKEQSSGNLGGWTDGIPMSPAGNGQFTAMVYAENIPGAETFGESWVQYQFVALDKNGEVLARSEVFWNLTSSPCGPRAER